MAKEAIDLDTSVGGALATSITSEETINAFATVADVGLDAAINSGAFDGVPIFGVATGLYRTGRHIKNELFLRKTARFLSGLSDVSPEKRERFLENLREKGKTEEFGETILLILDRIDDVKKPLIIGRLFAAHVEGKLTYEQAMRLAAIVNRCYAPDLDFLTRFKPGTQGELEPIADSLFSTGLLLDCGLDGGTASEPGGTIYALNHYAELLLKYGLRADPSGANG